MKATKVLARAISKAFAATNLNPDLAYSLLQDPGVYRGAHNIDEKDFSTYQVQRVTGVEDETLTYETVGKEGGRLPREKASLLVAAGVAGYTPMPGEAAIAVGFNTDDNSQAFFPVAIQSIHAEGINCAGLYEGEPWADDFEANAVLIPTVYIGQAGLLSRSVFETCFQVEGATNVNVDELVMVDARLAESGLTFRDLFDYMFTPLAEDASTTKFFKRVMKKHKVTVDHDLLHFMKTGDLVEHKSAKADEETASPLAQFAEDVSVMRGKPLMDLYATVCKLARVKEDARQTTASKVKAHIIELVTEARLKNLIKAGSYEPDDVQQAA